MSQISLNSSKSSQHHEPQALQDPLEDAPPVSVAPPLRSTADKLPIEIQTEQAPILSQDFPTHVGQKNYDEWYNQSATQPQQMASRYTNDRATRPAASVAGALSPPQQWAPEQIVENYENIQQSVEFINLEVVAPVMQEQNIYGSRDSINKETLENDPKPVANSPKDSVASVRDTRQEASNFEVPSVQQFQQPPDQTPDNYEFASNDRNTFLETGELTDSHQEHEATPPSQDDENDEVPSDIPFLREVPGQSSSADQRRNDPTGQEQYALSSLRVSDPRRNVPSGLAQGAPPMRVAERTERRDVPPGQERSAPLTSKGDNETLERRNDPSGRERSLPPAQSRNDPSGEERVQPMSLSLIEPNDLRQVPGSGTKSESLSPMDGGLRQIPGGASSNEPTQIPDDRNNTRVVPGSQQAGIPVRECDLSIFFLY